MKRILFRVLACLASAAVLLGVVVVATMLYGQVSGEEFAPDTFQRRQYFYFELPIVRIKVSPITRQTNRPDLEQILVDKKYISPTDPPRRWDLVATYRRGQLWREGDAKILCQYLDATDGDGHVYWLQWTKDHTAMAKLFWPQIARLADKDRYFILPELFAAAESASDPKELQRDLNRLLARNREQLAEQVPE